MDDLPQPSHRARRALPLIASALTAIVVVSLLYLTSGIRSSQSPAGSAPIAVMSGPYLARYDFISPSVGWALVLDYTSFATSFRIFRTTDSASHWQLQYTGQAEGGQTYIHFFDRDHGFAYAGLLYRTVDAGVHWEQMQTPGYFSMFASAALGWSLGAQDHMYSTSDGGVTWKRLPSDLPGSALWRLWPEAWRFLGAVFGGYGAGPEPASFRDTGEGWLGAGYLDSPTVYLTIDGAVTWRAVAIPPPASANNPGYLTTVSVAPGGQVVVLISDETMLLGAYASDDLGKSWRAVTLPPTLSTFADLSFVDAIHWIALRAGYVYKTADAGARWSSVPVSGLPDDWRYVDAHAIDGDHAWWSMIATARSTDSALAMTSDGGRHWKTVNVPNPGLS